MASTEDYPAGCYIFVTKGSNASVPLLVGDARRIPEALLTDYKLISLLDKGRSAETSGSPFKTYAVQLDKHKIVAVMMGPLVGTYDSVVREWLVELGIGKGSVQMTMYGLGYGLDYGIYG